LPLDKRKQTGEGPTNRDNHFNYKNKQSEKRFFSSRETLYITCEMEGTTNNPRDDLDLAGDGEDEENEEELKKKGNDKLIALAAKGNYEELKRLLDKKHFTTINFEDKKKWTGLMWAACKDHVDIIRLLVENNAHKIYTDEGSAHETKPTLGVINTSIKQTPL